jgi:hypothetical protein
VVVGDDRDQPTCGPQVEKVEAISECPPGLRLQQTAEGDWRVVHAESGLAIPFVDWPAPSLSLPRRYAEIAATSLAVSGIDWTQPKGRSSGRHGRPPCHR